MKLSGIFVLVLLFHNPAFSQQVADTAYNPVIQQPMYTPGEGPVVFIDEGHHNFHTMNGRYLSFANLLKRDGYNVQPFRGRFEDEELAKGKILVISNALNEINVHDWMLPTPSAFSSSEMDAVRDWVNNGGSLFLIADHMPLAGAATDLAAQFGFGFTNGFAMDTLSPNGPAFFDLKDKSLADCPLTKGRDKSESVSRIATFTGQAFKIPENAASLLTFGKHFINMMPDTAWVFHPSTPTISANGWSQGAYMKFGKGRVVMFGEAAMFSAQLAGPQQLKMGMNNDAAPENYQLLLNIIHWLDGKLE
ncbi:MAG TPA: DUF4350 domain-containing protein [Flavilitoribacter sp.]|nr:DUF4350 domain-containing protein [Flavilitoribacter sp.]HMQ90447.1 DUF4350 domain-containing protein [Flavilitoribacter sp.]